MAILTAAEHVCAVTHKDQPFNRRKEPTYLASVVAENVRTYNFYTASRGP